MKKEWFDACFKVEKEWKEVKEKVQLLLDMFCHTHYLDEKTRVGFNIEFLRVMAPLLGEEYDDINELVDIHGNYGVYTVVYNPIEKDIRMSSNVEVYDDIVHDITNSISQYTIFEFIQEYLNDNTCASEELLLFEYREKPTR